MSRKHFEAIAAILHGDLVSAQSEAEYYKVRGIILSLADYFQTQNHLFNRGRFYVASGLGEDGMPR